uniref:Uncharacterized protein n=1 Tax=Oncorhynchus kisutch TaxID=8019 RepID=A0A8C7I3T4_ONCKI
ISLCPELRLTYGQLRQLVQCELLQLQSTDYGSLLTTGNEDLTVKENILNEFRSSNLLLILIHLSFLFLLSGCDWETHREAPNWSSAVNVNKLFCS